MDGCAVDANDLPVTPDLAVAYERTDAVVAEPPSCSNWAGGYSLHSRKRCNPLRKMDLVKLTTSLMAPTTIERSRGAEL